MISISFQESPTFQHQEYPVRGGSLTAPRDKLALLDTGPNCWVVVGLQRRVRTSLAIPTLEWGDRQGRVVSCFRPLDSDEVDQPIWSRRWESNPRPDDYKGPYRFSPRRVSSQIVSFHGSEPVTRVLARNGAVSLDANTITTPPACTAATSTTSTSTTTPATTATTTPGGTGGSGTGGKEVGSTGSITSTGSTGSGEAATGAGSAAGIGATSAVVPVGFPHTGFGGAAHSRNDGLIGLGALALVGSTGVLALTAWRRHDTTNGTVSLPPRRDTESVGAVLPASGTVVGCGGGSAPGRWCAGRDGTSGQRPSSGRTVTVPGCPAGRSDGSPGVGASGH